MKAGNMKKLTRPDWSMMVTEILEQIWKRLEIPHQAQVSTVCKTWHSSTANKANIWAHQDMPWLITDEEETDDDDDEEETNSSPYRLFSITLGKNFYIPKPFAPSDNALIIGSCKGWMVIDSEAELFILNIFSKLRINLPPRSSIPDGSVPLIPSFFTMSMCAKLNPIAVVGITLNWNLIWCNIGDKEWKCYTSNENYINATFHNDKLYVINKDVDKVDVFRFDNDGHELICLDTIRATIPNASRSDTFDVHLVESNGSLLLVKRYSDSVHIIDQTIGFDIFKVQERTHGDSPGQLVNVKSLGDQALFISEFFCESLPVKDCPKFRENRIYFIGDHPNGYDAELVNFSVGGGNIIREKIPHSGSNSPIWLLPRYAFECNCKCHPSPLWRPANQLEGDKLC